MAATCTVVVYHKTHETTVLFSVLGCMQPYCMSCVQIQFESQPSRVLHMSYTVVAFDRVSSEYIS